VESFVKGTFRSFDPTTARLFAKIASYTVVTIASLAAIAELGIASQFIMILFMGVVFAFALGAGLALGLGGQDTVKKVLSDWYKRREK
jgi:small-conductance mechanosensitive channel